MRVEYVDAMGVIYVNWGSDEVKNACQRDDSRKAHAVILDIPQGSRMAMLQLNGIVNFSIEVLGCSQAAKTSGNSHT